MGDGKETKDATTAIQEALQEASLTAQRLHEQKAAILEQTRVSMAEARRALELSQQLIERSRHIQEQAQKKQQNIP